MVLRLLGPLRWEAAGQPARSLPCVLPTAILLVLARSGRAVTRDKLAALFWPDQRDELARLNLRVNLHKARRLLADLAIGVPVEADRRSVRWSVPVDADDSGAPGATPADGFALPGFDQFEDWLGQWRAMHRAAAPDAGPDVGAIGDGDGGGPPTFHGRRLELARLRTATARAIVVSGEPGIGKTTLVAAAFSPAHWLRCREGMAQGSFGAVAELLAVHPAWLEELGAYRLDVARLLPDIAPDEPLPPLDALTARVRLFEALARTVERNVELLAVDDLQWADAATVEWLAMLAYRGRVRWVATARPDELPATTRTVLAALDSAGVAARLPLHGLERPALDALLHQRRPDLAGAGAGREHRWLRAMADYTGGNPFCAIELIDAVTARDEPRLLAEVPLPERVAGMVRRRRDRLDATARAVVDAASLAVGVPAVAQLAAMAGLGREETLAALERAQAHGLVRDTACRHDVVREAIRGAIGATRAAEMHRRAAVYLADAGAEPELVAQHARQAGDPELAWPWVLRAAYRLKQRGERAATVAALCEVRDRAANPALALRAEVMLAQEHLFNDLAAGREALESTLARTAALPRGRERQTIEANALSGLVDNAVFGGDLPRAMALARALRRRLPGLAQDVLVEAHQVLIEATMRHGDFDAARRSARALRHAGAAPAVVLSFEAQIHWFAGDVRAARAAFEDLLLRHADYCHGLTIENDLAVMCHALGDLAAAEAMARRSLASWAGVAHTEALSSLVLGTTLTSMGRFAEARAALDRAYELGRRQGSSLFASEALVRRARLHWCAGERAEARAALLAASDGIGEVTEPLRASGLALMETLTAVDIGVDPAPAAAATLAGMRARSRHPLVHVRALRAQCARALRAGDRAAALVAARELAEIAREAALLEWLCEACALVAALAAGSEALAARARAQALARSQGIGWLLPRADGGRSFA